MRINHLLSHICDLVLDGVETGRDRYNRPIYEDVMQQDVKCRVDRISERIAQDDTGNDVIVTHQLYLSPGVVPTNDMKVRNIRDENGRTVIEGSFRVLEIFPIYKARSLHHYEIGLQREGN